MSVCFTLSDKAKRLDSVGALLLSGKASPRLRRGALLYLVFQRLPIRETYSERLLYLRKASQASRPPELPLRRAGLCESRRNEKAERSEALAKDLTPRISPNFALLRRATGSARSEGGPACADASAGRQSQRDHEREQAKAPTVVRAYLLWHSQKYLLELDV